jgi:hypothetical protein
LEPAFWLGGFFFDTEAITSIPTTALHSIEIANAVIPDTWETDTFTQVIRVTNVSSVEQTVDLIASGCCGTMQFEPRTLSIAPGQTSPVSITLPLRETCNARSAVDHFKLNARFEVTARSSLGVEKFESQVSGRVNHVFASSKRTLDFGLVPSSDTSSAKPLKLREFTPITSITARIPESGFTANVIPPQDGEPRIWQLRIEPSSAPLPGRREFTLELAVALRSGANTTIAYQTAVDFIDDYIIAVNEANRGVCTRGESIALSVTLVHLQHRRFAVDSAKLEDSNVACEINKELSASQTVKVAIPAMRAGHCQDRFLLVLRDESGTVIQKKFPLYYYVTVK